MKALAVVTGATGIVGSRIVEMLLQKGYSVRILTRNPSFWDDRLQVICGDLQNTEVIKKLLEGAKLLFHCAAELKDESKMWQVNANGTENLIKEATLNQELQYICHLSSVGVIGQFKGRVADEQTLCNPLNTYEKTKLAAEVSVKKYNGNAKLIILRPTNVVSQSKNSICNMNALRAFIQGGENAHLLHADDVASAALYFVENPSQINSDCFIVSCDHDNLNTVAGSRALCRAIVKKLPLLNIKPKIYLPWQFSYLLRRILKGPCNRSDVRYSSAKLLAAGFVYPLGLVGALKELCQNTLKC